jgi:hypothetical protein
VADPNSYGFGYDPFGTGIPQLLPKFDGSQNMLTQPGVGVPVGFGTGAGLAGGIVGTAVGNPLVNSALDAAKLPGDAYLGNVDLNSPAGFARAQNMAGMLMGGGMPMAEGGAAGIFGGKLAQAASMDDLRKAQRMMATRSGDENTWRATGWMQGPDKEWKFEIPDQKSALKTDATDTLASKGVWAGALSDILDHPELFKQYPDLAKMDVIAQYNPMGPGTSGSFHGNYIRLNSNQFDGPNGMHGALLHELQHAVQDKEGFARGASPSDFTYKNSPLFAEKKSGEDPYDTYRRVAGEVEARMVQSRMPVSDLGRKLIYPTPDVLPENQIMILKDETGRFVWKP